MCAIYVELLCAVMFILGWAHNSFYVAYHILMHFHAYVPSSLYILILICLVLFCASLSPSLFLALVCSMAPKRKSTPSWNPFHSGASFSSSPSDPSHIQFRDDKAHEDFSENFSRRGIHSNDICDDICFLTWWWHFFSIHCLTITLSQSLVLDFCYPFLRDSLMNFPLTSFYLS